MFSSLTRASHLIILALCANYRVDRVSFMASTCGFTLQIITVFELPPRASLSR